MKKLVVMLIQVKFILENDTKNTYKNLKFQFFNQFCFVKKNIKKKV